MIWIILFCLVVIVLLVVLAYLWFGKKNKVKTAPKTLSEKPKEEKPIETETIKEAKSENNDEVPEILKEVTQGNYMHDLAESDDDPLQFSMAENSKLRRSDMTFKPIKLDDEVEDQPMTTKDILDQLDGDESTSITNEIKKMSPEMKAILISNLLNKNDRF